jgi:predicted thioesterase
MKNPFQPGDVKTYETYVTEEKLARFASGVVHPVYSTFALAQDAEWCCRLFVLDMLEPEKDEEGVGTFVSVKHLAPAPLGSKITIRATLLYVKNNTIHCRYEAYAGTIKIAEGEQTQKIISKTSFWKRIQAIQNPTSKPS